MPHHTVDDREFEHLTDQLPAAVFVQVKGRFAYLNREALRILGETSYDTLIGKPILSRIPRERWAETTARIAGTNRDRVQAPRAEQDFIRADGSLVRVEVSSTPFRFGGLPGALVFVRDLTEQNNFIRMVEELPAGVFVQTEGRFALVNQAARKILGIDEGKTIVGEPVLSHFTEASRAQVLGRIRRLNEGRQAVEKASEDILRPDGQVVPVEVSAIPTHFRGSDGALVFLRDLTDDANLRNLVDHLPIGVIIGTGGRFEYLNPEALRIFGAASADQLVGTPVIERIADQWKPAMADHMRKILQLKQPVEGAFEEFLRLDGSPVAVEGSGVPFRHNGKDGALVFLRDLTAENAAKANLEVKDRLLRLTGAMAKVGGWEFRTSDGEGTWTDEVAHIHDVDPSAPTDMSFGLKFYTPESRTRIEAAIAQTVQNAVPFDVVLELVSATGRRKWVRSQGTPILHGGKVVQVQGIFQDITDSWMASQAVLEEKERLRVTLRSIGDGVITTDTAGNVLLMSQSAEELTGWSQDEAQGKNLAEVMPLVHEWTKRPLDNPVNRVLAEGSTVELANHTVLVAKDGRERVIADSAAPIVDHQGRVTGVVLVFRDMTEKQRLAEALQRAQNLESIGLLAAGIAHDFNNLLSGLFGQIQLAADKVASGRVAEARVNFDRALGVFDRARDLTGQLLTFSKGGVPVRTPCDLGPLIRRTVQFALAGSNVGVQFDLASDLRTIAGDPNQLAQVFDNLVINARQAMPAGGTIVVTAENRTDPQGRWAVVTIQDQGPGIPTEVLARIFDPFYTTKPGGHGLGLAAVQSIVQRHEGRVEVDSEPGRGAAFRIYLPA